MESRSAVPLEKVLSSPERLIDANMYLVCVKDGVAYVRQGKKNERPLHRLSGTDIICISAYATYGADLYRVIKAKYE